MKILIDYNEAPLVQTPSKLLIIFNENLGKQNFKILWLTSIEQFSKMSVTNTAIQLKIFTNFTNRRWTP